MKITFRHFITCFLMFSAAATSIQAQQSAHPDSLLQKAHSYFNQSLEQQALAAYLDVLKADGDNFEALWHTSLIYARVGYRYDSEQEMMENYQKALTYAEKTLELYPDEGYAHFVYAVANGRISDLSDSQTRIKKSHVVKKHAQKAVELLPNYAPAWHLLGLWHSKIANVGSARQFAAGLFSDGLPEGASNQKAVEYMQKAIRLQPEQTLRYKLDLARHYERAGENNKAIQTLKEIVQIAPKNDIDKWNLERARDLLKKLS
ncbi:MAG: tetratricopeptide repeat protein [Gracilimonas sp.]|uniref:tetratricopeptide repeat protein n=1 Tax=Gracilimonas TaxID=649462 RepID=UPI001B22EC82|nr:tetratricopeptide repeat protein [Gracilimonas sp.]MBO6584513.1 tetratricopeptide repeat protein [Gracilimonas sp.]MBO6616216.1 tetratricopeptide repeat protein [Gracilimonas sp.]